MLTYWTAIMFPALIPHPDYTIQKHSWVFAAGTLTQNIMGFVWCSMSGKLYGKQAPPDLNTPHAITQDSELLSVLETGEGERHQQAVDFLTHLAICNTVVPATTAAGQLIYQVYSLH